MNQEEIIRQSILEDVGDGDHSSLACIDADRMGQMKLLVKQNGILAGVEVAKTVLNIVDPTITMEQFLHDGDAVKVGDVAFIIHGPVRSMLTAERTLLNFMQRMSGIATTARHYADRVAGTHATILDTRKTTPGLRVFEKYAVTCGGGTNHRMGMYDRVLMKDNHRRLWKGGDPDELDQAVAAARKRFPKLEVEVEVESLRECASALKAKPEWIMLDNMSIADMKKCVKMCKGISKTEASGGITLDRAKEVAATGVTAISLGCLTHSAGSVDLSLEWKSV